MIKLNIIICEDSTLLSYIMKNTFPNIDFGKINNVIYKPESLYSIRYFYENFSLINDKENWIFTTSIIIMDTARVWQKENKINELNITWVNKDNISFSPFKDGKPIYHDFWKNVFDIQSELLDKLL